MSEKKSRWGVFKVLAISTILFTGYMIVGSDLGKFGRDAVGVVEVTGIILDSKKTLARLEKFEEDKKVRAVVLRLNSPGGSVAPSQEIYEAVRKFSKPLVISMGSVAASGAFYIACGAKQVFANPGTLTGSIGVILEFANLKGLYEWAKVNRYAVKSGKFKDAGATYRDLTEEERTLFQGMIDDVQLQFKTAVVNGRHLSMEKVSTIADGRIMSGNQAKALNLVDELGTFKDAILAAAKLGQIQGKPRVIYANKNRKGILGFLMDDDPEGESSVTSWIGGILGFLKGLPDATYSGPGLFWLWGSR